jgi:hypothetical protein
LNEIFGDVRRLSGERQEPWSSGAGFPHRLVLNQTEDYASRMRKAWREAALAPPERQHAALCSFLKSYPDSPHSAPARTKLIELQASRRAERPCNSI